jgi:hypothetical protein
MGVIGVVMALDGLTVPFRMHEMTTIPVHHLLHAGMAAGAGLVAMALAANLPVRDRERSWWVLPAVLAPAIGMVLMWPSAYARLMGHAWLHFLDHLGIVVCSALAVFAAQAYVRGLGWPVLVLLVGMDAAAAGGFGSSPGPSPLLSPPAIAEAAEPTTAGMGHSMAASSETNGSRNMPLDVRGQELSQTLGCLACHSIDGTTRLGPTWKNLAGYPQLLADGTTQVADYQFLRRAILYPEELHLRGFQSGLMPTTFRAMLSGPEHADERDLNALISYINTLSDRSSQSTRPSLPDEQKK